MSEETTQNPAPDPVVPVQDPNAPVPNAPVQDPNAPKPEEPAGN